MTSFTHIDSSLLSSGLKERLYEFDIGSFHHLVLRLSNPVLVVTHDQETLSVIGGRHVGSGIQHANTQLFGVGVTNLTLISKLLDNKVLKSVGWGNSS